MKISTRLRLAIFVPAMMAMVIIIALVFSYQAMARTQASGDVVRQIRSSITELNHFVFSYILYHEERPKQQFLMEYDKLTQLLANVQVQSPDQQHQLDNIREDSVTMKAFFLQLVSNYESTGTTGTQELQGTEDRLAGMLLQRSYEADVHAASLRSLVDDGIRINENQTIGLILSVIVLATIPLTVIMARTRRGITSSIYNLSSGAAVIGSGNLDFRIEEQGNDEISDLSRAFNRMALSLKETTASKSDLEQEITRRTEAEEELKVSNEHLQENAQKLEEEIFERKELGKVLRLERDKLVSILDSMEDGVCIMSRDLGIEYVNPSMQALYGAVEGRKCHQYFSGLDDVCPWCNNPEVFSGATVRRETQIKGTGRIFEVTDAPLQNADGSISKLAVLHDITERKKTEQLKDEFIGMVSHELKTPLTVIIGALSTATHEALSKEQIQDLVQDAVSSAYSLAGIIENLLELSRSQANRLALHAEKVNVREIARDVVVKLQPMSTAHYLVIEMSEGLPAVIADAIRFERILYNLVENAIKYSPNGGEVKVSAKLQDNNLVVWVSDQGPGISAENQNKLFQSFEQLGISNRRAVQGVGLGLKVCRTLVEAHHGQIWVKSQEGKGSNFFFSLPLTESP